MKPVGHTDRHVDISGVAETAQMTIHADARMFRNLLDSIYSEKEKTVVRELMANAFDAHVVAGCPEREIEVHLPTLMDPTLVIRDYGCGMSHDFMMKLYSALGFSSKTADNTQTGAFGVGSKSPLSITDSFTVKAYDGDRVRTYIITIPSDEHPQISYAFTTLRPEDYPLESETPWTERKVTLGAPLPGTENRVNFERGIEVTVPLDLKRRAAVLDGLASQHFCWFDKPVKFLGALEEIQHKFYTSIATLGDGLYLATPSNHSDNHDGRDRWNVYVRQGAAVYPLNEHQVMGVMSTHYGDVVKKLCSNGRHILIDLPLGTANVTLAREALQYDTVSTTNIAKVVATCFENFGTMLEHTIGNARDFYMAQRRIVEKFYPADQHDKFPPQRLAASMLFLCEKRVLANYDVWHKKLPDVAEYIDEHMKDATGIGIGIKRVATGNMIRPPHRYPRRQVDMRRLSDFPEGKVLLHKGSLTGGHSYSTNIGGAEESISFRAPSVIFILPSHLKEWKDRIRDYCKLTYKVEDLPTDSGSGVPIQVIRCAKRSIDECKAALLAHGILTKPVEMEELPNIATHDTRKRNFSKTSVYPWKNSTWADDKIEPDYDAPAYYLSRVGIAHDVHLTHPTKPHQQTAHSLQRQQRTTNHNVANLLTDGVRLGLIDAALPVYRVTENQATRIADNVTDWIHLGSTLADAVEAKLKGNMKVALGKSKLATASGLIGTLLPTIRSAADYPTDERFGTFLDFFLNVAEDPLFEMCAAVRFAVLDKPNDFKEDSTFDRLYRGLFVYASNLDREQITKFEKLHDALTAKYEFLARFADDRHNDRWIPHARHYLDGIKKVWDKEPAKVNLDDYSEFQPFVTDFRANMDAIITKRQSMVALTDVLDEVNEEVPYELVPRRARARARA